MKTNTKDTKHIFFLFGSTATDRHEENVSNATAGELAELLKDCEYATFFWEEGITHPGELLREYDGYDGYVEISKELYELLQK